MRTGNNAQITPKLKVWTRDQCDELHLKSLAILERTGIVVLDSRALKVYKDGGAIVKENKVFIPAWMVKQALKTAPERIVLKGRGTKSIVLEKNQVNYGLGTDLPFFHDRHTGGYRRTVLQDVVNVAKVVDSLPNLDFVASLGVAQDVTTELADLYHLKAMLENTAKPILMTARDKDNLQGLIDMAAICVGGYEELKQNPVFLLYAEPISPFVNPKESMQKLMLASDYEIPITYASGICSGSTGPVTLAGSLAVGNAECLAGLVLHQLINPGAPFLYGIVSSPTDMKTTICTYGGPEMPLGYCVVGAMARYYNLPSYGQSGCTDSAVVDQQAGIEAMFSIFIAALSGTNLVHDNGYLGNGLVGSLEMLVLCDEGISLTKHFMKGIEISTDTLALDEIHAVGPGGSFLGTGNTNKYSSTINGFSRYFNRQNYQTWVAEGNVTMNQRIKEAVDRILENHQPSPLESGLIEQMDKVITEHEKRIAQC